MNSLKHNNMPLVTLLGISLGLHAVVFFVINHFNFNTVNIVPPYQQGATFSIALKETNKIDKIDPIHKKTIQEKTTPQIPAKSEETILPSESHTKLTEEKTILNKTSSSTIEIQSASKARIVSILYKGLSQHFTYPRLAQRRNWQGKVLLSLHVTSSGKIENIKVNSSSGYNILDQAAIASLTKVGQLPQVSSWLHYGIDINIPVIYQLTKG